MWRPRERRAEATDPATSLGRPLALRRRVHGASRPPAGRAVEPSAPTPAAQTPPRRVRSCWRSCRATRAPRSSRRAQRHTRRRFRGRARERERPVGRDHVRDPGREFDRAVSARRHPGGAHRRLRLPRARPARAVAHHLGPGRARRRLGGGGQARRSCTPAACSRACSPRRSRAAAPTRASPATDDVDGVVGGRAHGDVAEVSLGSAPTLLARACCARQRRRLVVVDLPGGAQGYRRSARAQSATRAGRSS